MTNKAIIEKIRSKSGFICDMDGVIYHGNKILDGVKEFVSWLKDENKKFVFLTNSSARTIKELQGKLSRMGLDVGPEHFYTSALGNSSFPSKPETKWQRLHYRRSRAYQCTLQRWIFK